MKKTRMSFDTIIRTILNEFFKEQPDGKSYTVEMSKK